MLLASGLFVISFLTQFFIRNTISLVSDAVFFDNDVSGWDTSSATDMHAMVGRDLSTFCYVHPKRHKLTCFELLRMFAPSCPASSLVQNPLIPMSEIGMSRQSPTLDPW